MTVKQLSETFNVSTETIRRAIKEVCPNIIQNGKRTVISQEYAILIGEKVRKAGYIQPLQNVEVPSQNAEVEKRLDRLEEMFTKMMEAIPLIVSKTVEAIAINQFKQIESKPNKMTVKEYIRMNNIKTYDFENFVKSVGKVATASARELNRGIEFVSEESFNVGRYDLDILKHSVEMVRLNIDKQKTLFN